MKLVISTSLFFMEKGYRKFYKYMNGLIEWEKNIKEYLSSYEVKVIVYYDDSIKLNKELYSEFKEKTRTPLFELRYFNYPEFKSKVHKGHLSTFGTLIRFLPLFEDNDSIVLIRDLDIKFQPNNNYQKLYDFLENDKYKMLFYKNYLTYEPSHIKVLPSNKYNEKFMANGIFKIKWNIKLFNQFLNDIKNPLSEPYKILEKVIATDKRKTLEQNIVYGIDEIFLNYVLLNNITKEDKIKILRFYDDKYYLLEKLKRNFGINEKNLTTILKKYKHKLTDEWIFVLTNWNINKTYEKIFF